MDLCKYLMRTLTTLNLDEQGLDRLEQWDRDHPSHWIRILSVLPQRWHDRYIVVCDCTEAEALWLTLRFSN